MAALLFVIDKAWREGLTAAAPTQRDCEWKGTNVKRFLEPKRVKDYEWKSPKFRLGKRPILLLQLNIKICMKTRCCHFNMIYPTGEAKAINNPTWQAFSPTQTARLRREQEPMELRKWLIALYPEIKGSALWQNHGHLVYEELGISGEEVGEGDNAFVCHAANPILIFMILCMYPCTSVSLTLFYIIRFLDSLTLVLFTYSLKGKRQHAEIKKLPPSLTDHFRSVYGDGECEVFRPPVYSEEDLATIEKETRGQHKNRLWHAYREGVITATRMHGVL